MSFSNDVKNELTRLEDIKPCCQKAELFGLLKLSGAVSLTGSGIGIKFSTENAALARHALHLLKDNFNVQTEVIVTRSRRLKKNNKYQVQVIPNKEVRVALQDLKLLEPVMEGKKHLLGKQCCRKAFLRGAFLAGGSVSKPVSDYHLELVTESEDIALLLQKNMQGFSLPAKITDRKRDYVVYLKEGDAITDFLSVIGAHHALLEFENIRVVKEMRNNVNRRVNCETANLGKIVQAAVRQLNAIKYIDEVSGISKLSEPLREAARLRQEYPESSVQELAQLAQDQPSKSGFNHRLRRLEYIATKLGMEEENV